MTVLRRLALTALIALTPIDTAPAATIHGRALDPSGLPVAGVHVEAYAVRSAASDPAATATTDERGTFTLDVPADTYALVLSSPLLDGAGQVTVTDTESRDIPMQPVVRESMTVKAPQTYEVRELTSAMKTPTPLRDIPQAVSVVNQERMQDQLMSGVTDVVRYLPGVTLHQGEGNRDQIIMRGNSSSADFFVDGVRDDVQYYRDVYNLERVEALMGPNALIFGRGGAGGVLNRVTKEAGPAPLREIAMQGGAWNDRRITGDFDQPLTATLSMRINGMKEKSESFRDHVGFDRSGIAPAFAFQAGDATRMTLSLERFRDRRTADRGITSFRGRPADVPIDTFFGNPNQSRVRADVTLATAGIEHQAGRFTIRNRTMFGDYDRGYQNFVPGAVSADKSRVAITAYNNATKRRNVFTQTDAIVKAATGAIRHTILGGIELGQQTSDNFRNTGYFNNASTSTTVSYANPTVTLPVVFRQSATDADNHVDARVAAAYAQDQITLSRHVQLVTGVRIDRFDLSFTNHRNNDRLRRSDDLLSPRAGVIVKPIETMSLYASYGKSWLPSSGDQFSSLTSVTQQLKPEAFDNYEAGIKWDVTGALSLTSAVYRLDRTNTRATDPNDPTRIVQTGSQRSEGVEIGVNGNITDHWKIAAAYTRQRAFITTTTASAAQGKEAGQVPHQMFSLWTGYDFARTGVSVGMVSRTAMFTSFDNTVVLPGYATFDASVYYAITDSIRAQVNVENAFDRQYYLNADSNTNISPGKPRTVRLGFTTRF